MSSSGVRVEGSSRWRSLRWRLPLLIGGACVAVLGVVLYAAYREVEATLLQTGGERARHAADQVSGLFGRSTRQSFDQLQQVAPTLREYLRDPTDVHLVTARNALASLAAGPNRHITVWNAAGTRMFDVPVSPITDNKADVASLAPLTRPPELGLGPIHAVGNRLFTEVGVAVQEPSGSTRLGVIGVRSGLAVSPPDLLARLVGDDARILVGNRRGDVWTDLTHVVPGPDVDVAADGVKEYRSPSGDRRLGALSGVPATPWAVWVEFPRAALVSPATRYLRRMIELGLAMAVATMILVRWLTIRVTTPLATMTTAAEAMAAGDYSRRVDASRPDEIGRLGHAFNAMTEQVATAYRALEDRVAERQMSESRYRTLFDYAPDGIIIADAKGVYLDANARLCEMLGYTRDELIGMDASQIVTGSDLALIEPALDAIVNNADYHREWQFRRKDGSVFLSDVIATLMPDGNLLAMVRDVTERDAAAAAVRSAEERMRFALEAAGVGIWDMDVESGVLKWSDTFEAHHGLQRGVTGGSLDHLLERIHPQDREAVVSAMRSVNQAGADFALEYRAIWPDGTTRWLNGAGRILVGQDGEAVRGVGVSLDVTARHVLEVQFQQSQKMEAVGQLAGGVAHDFNNLLTAVLGFSRLVRDSLDEGDPRIADIDEVIQAGIRATALTKQLLAFSRKEVIQPVAVDLNALIENTHSMLRRLIGEDIEVALALGSDVAPIYADPGQLDQILMNLAVNARDAMPNGGRLTIETANVDLDASFGSKHGPVEAGPYVMLAVSDNGIGMSEEVRQRLFEPFFTTKERGKGTGLGLSTVFGIVKQNGGYIYVYSEPTQGATFKVFLPRLAVSPRPAVAPTDVRVRAGSETVLLVEDEEAVRLLVRLILQNTGYRVLVASNPQEAEGVFADSRNDVAALITDVIMPGGSGPALFESLFRIKPDLRVLYMSGYTDEAMFQRGRLGQGATFLQKPFAAGALLRTLREVLDSPPSMSN